MSRRNVMWRREERTRERYVGGRSVIGKVRRNRIEARCTERVETHNVPP